MSLYIHIKISIYICMYIYIERERERGPWIVTINRSFSQRLGMDDVRRNKEERYQRGIDGLER